MNHKPSIRRRPSGYGGQAIRVAASPRHLLPLGSGWRQATTCPETSGRRGNHSLVSHSPEETREIARKLIQNLSLRGEGETGSGLEFTLSLSKGKVNGLTPSEPHDAVIALYGELGSGKTCFVQGIATALGIRQAVTSPTFTIVNEYRGTCPLYHIDLYRIHSPDEVLALGFEEYLEMEGIKAIEWAERAGDLIPTSAIRLSFEIMPDPEQRRITVFWG